MQLTFFFFSIIFLKEKIENVTPKRTNMPKKSNVKKRKLAFTHTKIGGQPLSTRVAFNYSTQNQSCTSSTSQAINDNQCLGSDTPAALEIPVDLASGCENTSTNRKMRQITAWQLLRPKLRKAYFETVVPTSDICCTCGDNTTEPVVCMDCTSRKVLCVQCALNSHRVNLQFHNMLQLKDGIRVKLNFCKELIATDHECDSHYLKSMTIFDSKGCMHSCQVTFCRCSSEMENLVRIGFWPSSAVDPICALSIHLLNWISYCVLETQSSVKSICQSLKWIHRMPEKDATYMYRTLMNETLEEFRHFSFMVSSLNSEASCLDDGTSCPACPKTEGDAFISLDANFGLVRKKNAGQSLEPPKHSSRYFLDQDESDAFVNSYLDNEVPKDGSEECSNFQAINTIRAKNKIANLDCKGVFGSACRHGIPKLFVSMRHGERNLGHNMKP
ncbi:hypothetical protein HOLleu_08940 [Holothuria leucospilota]|uniref:CxC2-like cysteine cluster KDZ transposase-associated domain-containing protein n=1 Tax=Holothuria leucospilota TaxID=206669 RepID=A0A9Q1HHC5_HOLLE|nr:hypothetical protein HOLleu_08940 [Holothuria leucospilota]